MSKPTTTAEPDDRKQGKLPELNWRYAGVLGLLLGTGVGVILALWRHLDADVWHRLKTGLGVLPWILLAILIVLGLLLWLILGTGISGPGRRRLLWAVASAGAAAPLLVRIDGFSGNLTPQLAWRWSPTANQQVEQYFAQTSKAGTAAPDPADAGCSRATAGGQDHAGFLGSDRTGVIPGVRLSRAWNLHPPRELWRHPVGWGWSGFAIQGHCAWTQEQRGRYETVVCYDLRTGRERWVHQDAALFTGSGVHGDGPRATPTVHLGRIYALGATGILNCLDCGNGQLLWQQRVLPHPDSQNLLWGQAGSPLVDGNRVIVTPGGGPGRSIIAFDLDTGDEVWAAGNDPAGYSSPQSVVLRRQPQILVFNGAGLAAHNPANGSLFWSFPWVTQGENRVNVAQPLVGTSGEGSGENDAVLITSGYGEGCAVLRVTREGTGWGVDLAWKNTHLKSKFSNAILHQGYVYGLDDGVLVCLNFQTGSRLWKRGRYGHGQLLLAGDTLLIQAESGEIVLVAPSPESWNELGRFPALPSKTWNHPALAGNLLLVRNDRMAACLELPLAHDSPFRTE